MKRFILLQLRLVDEASDNEYESFVKFGGFKLGELRRIRMEKEGIPPFNIDDYAGIIIGGGPGNVSDLQEKKPEHQVRYEKDLEVLLDKIVEKDFPFLGICYGIGALINHQKGKISKENYSEDVGAIPIEITEEGAKDSLLKGLPKNFRALGGHKEACDVIPEHAVLLAKSEICPNQIVRIKNNVYASQFHPELDVDGIILRINIYKHAGYFPPEDAEKLIEEVKKETITVPAQILSRFVEMYRD
jgi:GMP synthase (glutamine-hydrolysing)